MLRTKISLRPNKQSYYVARYDSLSFMTQKRFQSRLASAVCVVLQPKTYNIAAFCYSRQLVVNSNPSRRKLEGFCFLQKLQNVIKQKFLVSFCHDHIDS